MKKTKIPLPKLYNLTERTSYKLKTNMQITYTNVIPLWEAVKQGLRVFAVAVIPLLINQLNNSAIDWRAIIITGVIAVLMAVDKGLHLEGKVTDNTQLTKGLTQF